MEKLYNPPGLWRQAPRATKNRKRNTLVIERSRNALSKLCFFIAFLLVGQFAFGQCGAGESTIYITTSGGLYPTEKWVSITTEANGAGTQVWGQGDGTYGNAQGLLTDEEVCLAPGNYYVNCYDRYADSWDGTTIEITAYGSVIGDNGGANPDDGTDDDTDSTWEDPSLELEASFMITVPEEPSCLPPSGMTADSITADSADLSWTAGDSGETAWNLVWSDDSEFDPEVDTPTGSDTTGTNTGFPVSGLADGTEYDLYYQADCGGGDTSEWVGPFTFTTEYLPPANDECTDAIALTVNADLACGTVTSGTTVGGTASPQAEDDGEISGTPDNDVWFIFQATAIAHEISLSNVTAIVGTSTDMAMAVYDATGGCNGLVLVDDSDPNSFAVEGLTAGTDYFLRVYGYYTGTSSAQTTFDVCVGTAPVPGCAANLTATPDASCGNQATAITWDTEPDADGYKLTIGTTSGGNDVLDAFDTTSTSYDFVGEIDTQYFYTVVPYSISGDATGCTEQSFSTMATGCYCESEPSNNDSDGVTNVTVGTTDFPTADVTYADHTATVVDLDQGQDANVQITFNTGYEYHTKIWIDLDDNYAFDEDEVFDGMSTSDEPTTLDASFNIPFTAPPGQHRMRIGTVEPGSGWILAEPAPCFSATYGVTLDFTINIVEAPCDPATVVTATVAPDCGNEQYSVDVDVTDVGDATEITDGTSTWPISGAGMVTAGPFNDGDTVVLTVVHLDTACNFDVFEGFYYCNDDIAYATPLDVDAGYCDGNNTNGNNIDATDSGEGEGECYLDYGENDVWFTFTVPAGVGSVDLSTDFEGGTNTDTELAVFSGSPGNLIEVACDEDGGDVVGSGYTSVIEAAPVTPGETYYVQVAGYGGTDGTFCLEISSNGNYATWNGSAGDNDWGNSANWDGNVMPDATGHAVIPNVSSMPTTAGDIDVSGMTLESGASFIAGGAVTGQITVERDLTANWHLISSPVTGASMDDYMANNDLATGTVANNVGLASYDNSSDPDTWEYCQDDGTSYGDFDAGEGLSTQLTAAATVSFTGELTTGDVAVSIDIGSGPEGFNLIGNPYAAYLDKAALLTAATDMEATLWLWNGSTGEYTEFNNLEGDDYIAPAQGFFVQTTSDENFTFTESMQSHTVGTYYKTANEDYIKLALSLGNGTMETDARIYLLDNSATTAFDNGYDSSMFTGSMPELGVYTRSVADDVDNKLAIQALPNGEFDEMVIPVGVIAPEGGDLTFALSTVQNLPDNINVYLEDTVTGSMTLLNDGGEYQVTLGSGEDGEGRFFINLSNATFSVDGVGGNGPHMMLVDGNRLLISKVETNATLTVYNLLGQAVWAQGVEAQDRQYVELNLSTGAYIAKLEGNGVQATKKIVINH